MNKAVILCGGRGERLRPLTSKTPKPLIKIGGQPVLEHLINVLKKGGVEEIYLAVSYLGEKIEEYFQDGQKWGVKIYYSYDREPLGGAGAIKLLEKRLDVSFVVLNGDFLTNLNLIEMVNFHRQKRGTASFLVHRTNHPYDSDLVEYDDNFLVKRFFRPKPGDKFKPVSKSGAHIFEPEVFKYIPMNKSYSLEKELIPELLKKGKKLYAFYNQAYSKDIGTWPRLKKARQDFRQGKI